jgi:hypothetical protein
MSKHKVKRYNGEEDSEVSAEDEAAMDAAGRFVESGPKTMTMPRRPVSRTPVASSRVSGPGRKPSGPSQQSTTDTEPRDRFGIPTSLGDAGKNYAPTGKNAEPVTGTELTRNLEAAVNATGAGGILQGVRRGVAGVKGLREFIAGRAGAKPAMEAAKRVEPAMKTAKSAPSVNVRPSAADPKIMEKVSAALKNAPRPVSKPTASQAAFAKGPKGPLSRLRADTMDEFGAAMKRGGSVKRYASGGSISSRADGIAQRGKTRGKMC